MVFETAINLVMHSALRLDSLSDLLSDSSSAHSKERLMDLLKEAHLATHSVLYSALRLDSALVEW